MERQIGPGLADWSGIGGLVNLPGTDIGLADRSRIGRLALDWQIGVGLTNWLMIGIGLAN